jgi:hypothetical protein
VIKKTLNDVMALFGGEPEINDENTKVQHI